MSHRRLAGAVVGVAIAAAGAATVFLGDNADEQEPTVTKLTVERVGPHDDVFDHLPTAAEIARLRAQSGFGEEHLVRQARESAKLQGVEEAP